MVAQKANRRLGVTISPWRTFAACECRFHPQHHGVSRQPGGPVLCWLPRGSPLGWVFFTLCSCPCAPSLGRRKGNYSHSSLVQLPVGLERSCALKGTLPCIRGQPGLQSRTVSLKRRRGKSGRAQARVPEAVGSVILILAAAGLQGGPQSPGCCYELGRREGRDSPEGLQHGARPAPAASAELAFPQECLGEERSTA